MIREPLILELRHWIFFDSLSNDEEPILFFGHHTALWMAGACWILSMKKGLIKN
jgi:hypothetical protein